MVRAAIVGLGWWGKSLVNAVQGKSGDISFVAGQTRSRAKAEEFCRDKGVKLVDDYDAILADPTIDAVVLATPHSQHGDQVRRAAAAGKHVFVEKPFTLTTKDAEAALNAVAKAHVVLGVGFLRRFHPSMTELRARVRDGRLGAIETCISEQTANTAANIAADYWRADPSETPAGAMTGIGIHQVDSMIDLFGRVAEAHCVTARRAGALVDDTTSVLLRFNNGVTGMFFCSLATVPNYRFAVYGTKGFAEITKPTMDDLRIAPLPDPKAGHLAIPQTELKQTSGFDMLHAELTAFAAAVGKTAPYPISAEEVLHGVEVFEAIVKSAQTGKAVTIG